MIRTEEEIRFVLQQYFESEQLVKDIAGELCGIEHTYTSNKNRFLHTLSIDKSLRILSDYLKDIEQNQPRNAT